MSAMDFSSLFSQDRSSDLYAALFLACGGHICRYMQVHARIDRKMMKCYKNEYKNKKKSRKMHKDERTIKLKLLN
jgi:hypothetical protein